MRRVHECDVAVVGGGPAGIAAATRAAESGARVLMVDEGLGPGGQIWRPSRLPSRPKQARSWLARLDRSNATVVRSASVVDLRPKPSGFILRAEVGADVLDVDAHTVVLATGARELFLPFPGWTLPNVFGIGGAQALLKAGTDFRGRRVVIAGSGPLLLPVAASLAKSGAKILLVAEQAKGARVVRYAATLWSKPATLVQAAALRWAFMSTPYKTDTWVTAARGDTGVREVTVTDGRTSRDIACDVLCAGFGLVPNTELARLIGCAMTGTAISVDQWQATSITGVYAAGEPTGIGGVDLALVEGEIAGAAAAGKALSDRVSRRRRRLARSASGLERAFALRDAVRHLATPETIVCRCEDVRLCDVDRVATSRQGKLYTRAGMGPCQGRICGAALECVMGWTADSVRPPIQPALVSAFLSDPISATDQTSTDHGVH